MSLVLLGTQTDERLVALAREGHERAFEAIVKRYRRPLLSACRRMVPEARAEDVLQQALVSAWTALRRGDEVRELRAWLFRIVRNAAVSNLRLAGHNPPELLETLSAAASPQEEAERRAVVQETLEAVAGLPERQRDALLAIAVQGRSQDEVASDLGVSRIAVRQLVHRARTSLRAAASAVVPFPLVAWLATAGSGAEPMSLRIAQLVGGAGGAGATATLLKAGAVAGVAATAAVSAPILTEQRAPRPRPAAAQPVATTPAPTAAAKPARTAQGGDGASRPVSYRDGHRRTRVAGDSGDDSSGRDETSARDGERQSGDGREDTSRGKDTSGGDDSSGGDDGSGGDGPSAVKGVFGRGSERGGDDHTGGDRSGEDGHGVASGEQQPAAPVAPTATATPDDPAEYESDH